MFSKEAASQGEDPDRHEWVDVRGDRRRWWSNCNHCGAASVVAALDGDPDYPTGISRLCGCHEPTAATDEDAQERKQP